MSRLDNTVEEIATAFEGITVANGYASEVKKVYRVPKDPRTINHHPAMSVFPISIAWRALSSAKGILNIPAMIRVEAYCGGRTLTADGIWPDQLQPLLNDVQTVLYTLLAKNANSATNKWIVDIDENRGPVFRVVPLFEKENIGWFTLDLPVTVLYQVGVFT